MVGYFEYSESNRDTLLLRVSHSHQSVKARAAIEGPKEEPRLEGYSNLLISGAEGQN